MTGKLSKNFHGVGIGPLSKILAVNGNLRFSNISIVLTKKTTGNKQKTAFKKIVAICRSYFLKLQVIENLKTTLTVFQPNVNFLTFLS